MSGYPPPPPPGFPPGGQYPYASYDRNAWKMQRQMLKQQARMQRQQMRWQQRAFRRGSLVGPLLLLVLGVICLMAQIGRISWSALLMWYGDWWPMMLIGAGVLLLLEWVVDNALHGGDPQKPARTVSGGFIFLLIVLAIVGASSHHAERALAWKEENFGRGFPFMNMAMGERHDMDDTAESNIAPNGALLIRNQRGNVTVRGSSEDSQIHVSIHKNIRARSDEEAARKGHNLQPVFRGAPGSLVLDTPVVEGGNDDLVVEVPHGTVLTVNADHGTVDIQEIHAPISVTAGKGEVNLSGIGGGITAHIHDSDTTVTAHSVNGGIAIDGRTGDINLSDITGPVTLQGDFYGTTHMERVNGAVNFHGKHTQFQAARVDGEVEIEGRNGSDLQVNSVMGPVVLQTEYRNVALDRVQGSVRVTNRDGSVAVTNAPPLAAVEVNNRRGSVEIGLPEKAGFTVNAQTRNGVIKNDFKLDASEKNHLTTLSGSVAGGGPTIHIQTTDGDVTVHKSTVAPLPAIPPVPPKLTVAQPPKPTKAPHTPPQPKAPQPVAF